jgi:Ribbon-helix-helix protein, copG family
MSTTPQIPPTHERLQAWVPVELAEELRKHAAEERRSISSAIRNAIEDQLGPDRERDR